MNGYSLVHVHSTIVVLNILLTGEDMNEQQFKERTKQLALRVIRMVETLPHGRTSDVIGRQVLRSATSVGANYHAACRARSIEAMIAKLDIVLEEEDETLYWLELLIAAGVVPAARLTALINETDEITAMTVTSLKTLHAKAMKSPRRMRSGH
jgi:four helix bundle protein